MTKVQTEMPTKRSKHLIHPYVDFWLLGGASILVWAIMNLGQQVRGSLPPAEMRFMQIGYAFSVLALLCNHPHFLISYKIAYGRGTRFILRNWWPLLAVPAALLALYACAYAFYDDDISQTIYVERLNSVLSATGLDFQIGKQVDVGSELLGLSVWLMYVTVGWHYAKQVFGCIMVYSFYSEYEITAVQRWIIKASLFSLALLQFVTIYSRTDSPAMSYITGRILTPLGISKSLPPVLLAITIFCFTATIVAVFGRNYLKNKRLPPTNMVVAWLAFYVWWMPTAIVPEFMLVVPFFHSLQYLPFAYRVERNSFLGIKRPSYVWLTTKLLVLFGAGFLAFEILPSILDSKLQTSALKGPYFFLEAFSVFINVHHFFLDSAVWKFKDQDVRMNLLHEIDHDAFAVPRKRKTKDAVAEAEYSQVV